jgi:hypothetical protein
LPYYTSSSRSLGSRFETSPPMYLCWMSRCPLIAADQKTKAKQAESRASRGSSLPMHDPQFCEFWILVGGVLCGADEATRQHIASSCKQSEREKEQPVSATHTNCGVAWHFRSFNSCTVLLVEPCRRPSMGQQRGTRLFHTFSLSSFSTPQTLNSIQEKKVHLLF